MTTTLPLNLVHFSKFLFTKTSKPIKLIVNFYLKLNVPVIMENCLFSLL